MGVSVVSYIYHYRFNKKSNLYHVYESNEDYSYIRCIIRTAQEDLAKNFVKVYIKLDKLQKNTY